MESFTVGGMTEMEIHNISGPETIRAFTPVSAESIENASILTSNAIVMQLLHISYMTKVSLNGDCWFSLLTIVSFDFPELKCAGVVTKKASLPITQLNFGQTTTGVHTLGKFECSGDAIVTGMPTSCEDLLKIGHKMTGFYSVMGKKMVETIYCDFTKSLSDPGKNQCHFETIIG
jgi:hypothetical protein